MVGVHVDGWVGGECACRRVGGGCACVHACVCMYVCGECG